jgi:hypothetical protein
MATLSTSNTNVSVPPTEMLDTSCKGSSSVDGSAPNPSPSIEDPNIASSEGVTQPAVALTKLVTETNEDGNSNGCVSTCVPNSNKIGRNAANQQSKATSRVTHHQSLQANKVKESIVTWWSSNQLKHKVGAMAKWCRGCESSVVITACDEDKMKEVEVEAGDNDTEDDGVATAVTCSNKQSSNRLKCKVGAAEKLCRVCDSSVVITACGND